ncbi:DoxX family protein [Streptomyces sp. NPDC054861]
MLGTLMLLAVPTALFRLLGALGVGRFATWRVSVLHGLAVMLVFTAAAHFTPTALGPMPGHHDLVAMVPPFVPLPRLVVYATGVLELLGAAGLVREATRPAAGLGLAALFVLMFPANIHAAVDHIPFNGEPATPLWFRIPEQVVFIGVALWAYLPARAGTARRAGGIPA